LDCHTHSVCIWISSYQYICDIYQFSGNIKWPSNRQVEFYRKYWYYQSLCRRKGSIMIRLIAIDMDGTILSPDHSISTRNKQAILAAQSNGIEVVIATGRGFSEAYGPVRDSGLNLSYICLNGAEIRDAFGELISATH